MPSLFRPLAALRRTLDAHRRAVRSVSSATAAPASPPTPKGACVLPLPKLSHRRALRSFSSATTEAAASPPPPTPNGAYVVPLPKLSHLMGRGAVAKWRVREGDAFPAYAILAEVETAELVEPCYAQGPFAGRVRMLLEAQSAGVVARILVPATDEGRGGGGGGEEGAEGGARDLPVGTPIAVVVGEDELEDAEAEAEGRGADPAAARESLVAEARAWRVPTDDVLDGARPPVPVLVWQSFLASDGGGGEGGGGGGGMCAPGGGGACG